MTDIAADITAEGIKNGIFNLLGALLQGVIDTVDTLIDLWYIWVILLIIYAIVRKGKGVGKSMTSW